MATSYIISSRQVLSAVIAIALFVCAMLGFTWSLLAYYEQPDVQVDKLGKCVRVVNYKNGDGYGCQDVNVTLRKYTLVHVE